jgi:YgiT-type zinc finger domain-containing protein
MKEKRCPVCGNADCEVKKVEYIYRHSGRYLLVRDVPTEVCRVCGTRFYEAQVLHEIERSFFAMQDEQGQVLEYVRMPVTAYGAVGAG